MNSVRILIFIVLALQGFVSFSQTEKKFIRDGNKQYEGKKYSDSEISYRKSLEKNKSSFEGEFNLGDALYKQGKYEEAGERFSNLAQKETDKKKLSKVYHNLGNSLLQQKKYEESVEAFKNSLKNSPEDRETKYNLAYAQSMLRQQQQQQQQNKDDKNKDKQKQDKQSQGKEGDQKNDKKGEQNQAQKNEDKKDKDSQDAKEAKEGKDKKDQQAGKPKEQKISKEDAERILQALNNDEKEAQKKLSRKETQRMNIDKDW